MIRAAILVLLGLSLACDPCEAAAQLGGYCPIRCGAAGECCDPDGTVVPGDCS